MDLMAGRDCGFAISTELRERLSFQSIFTIGEIKNEDLSKLDTIKEKLDFTIDALLKEFLDR